MDTLDGMDSGLGKFPIEPYREVSRFGVQSVRSVQRPNRKWERSPTLGKAIQLSEKI